MHQSHRSILIFLIWFILAVRVEAAYTSFAPRLLQWELSGNYFSSTENYEPNRSKVKLPDGNYYKLTEAQLQSRYILNPNWAMFAGGNYAKAESTTGIYKRENTAFNKIFVGGQYLLMIPGLGIIPEFSVSIPMDSAATDSDFVPVNESVTEIIAQARFQKLYQEYSIFGNTGLNYRTGGRSTFLIWGGGVEGYFGMITLGAEIFGVLSLLGDSDVAKENTREDVRAAYINRVVGGSKMFYSYNPSIIDTRVQTMFNFTPSFRLGLNAGTTISGTNNASGFHGGLSLQMDFDFSQRARSKYKYQQPRGVIKSPRRTVRPTDLQRVPDPPSSQQQFVEDDGYRSSPRMSTDQNLDQFQSDSESTVDQNLFRAKPIPAPAPRPLPQQNLREESEYNMPPLPQRAPEKKPLIRTPRVVPSSELRQKLQTINPVQPPSMPLQRRMTRPKNQTDLKKQYKRTEIPAFQEDPSLQQQLDATEMQIELKQNKKKRK